MPITFEGARLGDLHVPPDTDPDLITRALGQLAMPAEWGKLGAGLAALGPHRLAIAARSAAAAASGGHGVSAEEEASLLQWFGGLIDEAIRRGGLFAAVAIWAILASDNHTDPVQGWATRCPKVTKVPRPPEGFSFERDEPGERGEPGQLALDPDEAAAFIDRLRVDAPSYMHTAIAGASDSDLRELREIAVADEDALEEFRPWGVDLAAEVPSLESLENARSMLTYRQPTNAETCGGVADWARGCASMVAEHALPPVLRIGAIAWLARVALRPAGDATNVALRPEEGATFVAVPCMEDTPRDTVQDPDAHPILRHCITLEAAGWHVIELRPSRTGAEGFWRVMIERFDKNMTMTIPEAEDPEVALEDLVRYVSVDRDLGRR